MAHVHRIETLSRHLTTATGVDMVSVADDLADSTVQVGQFNTRELYEYTVRDNIELRDRIFEFLKVSSAVAHTMMLFLWPMTAITSKGCRQTLS